MTASAPGSGAVPPAEVRGYCDPAFKTVREAFAGNLAERGETGAAVCVLADGRTAVDLWGGFADIARARPWQPDTLVNLFSVGKGLAEAATEHASGQDLVLDRPSRFGLGFQLPQPERPLAGSPAAFGHFGAGGSLGFCDPASGIAFGYVMNQMGPRWQSPRTRALLDALDACL